MGYPGSLNEQPLRSALEIDVQSHQVDGQYDRNHHDSEIDLLPKHRAAPTARCVREGAIRIPGPPDTRSKNQEPLRLASDAHWTPHC